MHTHTHTQNLKNDENTSYNKNQQMEELWRGSWRILGIVDYSLSLIVAPKAMCFRVWSYFASERTLTPLGVHVHLPFRRSGTSALCPLCNSISFTFLPIPTQGLLPASLLHSSFPGLRYPEMHPQDYLLISLPDGPVWGLARGAGRQLNLFIAGQPILGMLIRLQRRANLR